MKKIIISIILMVIGTLVFSQNLDTYFSYLEIVSVNPRARYDLLNASNYSSVNLDKVSSVFGTQFNVVVEEGLEETWNKLKAAYKLNPPADWVVTGISKDEVEEYFAIAYNMLDVRMLFVTKAHEDFYSIFRQSWAVFVQDPKGILKKKE